MTGHEEVLPHPVTCHLMERTSMPADEGCVYSVHPAAHEFRTFWGSPLAKRGDLGLVRKVDREGVDLPPPRKA